MGEGVEWRDIGGGVEKEEKRGCRKGISCEGRK